MAHRLIIVTEVLCEAY